MKKTYVMPLLVLTLICLAVSTALAFMNRATEPLIVSAATERAFEIMNVKIPDATGFEPVEFHDLDGMPASIREIYKTSNDVGYILIAAVNGFSGDITVICAVRNDGTIISTSTLSHTETKGIGTIIEQESFLSPFQDADRSLEGIDTVTGATISTRAFIHAIDDILTAFEIVR